MNLQKQFDKILGSLTLDGAGLPSFLVAVSGGVDSLTLATLFARSEHKPLFEVAHVNFSLRADESDGDESLVREWCRTNGIKFHCRRFDTLEYARRKSISIEMAARELRYGWFDEVKKERGLDLIAVAHNLNDNAETLILNLLRGTGLKGACGMKQLSSGIFRPLLEVSREEIEAFAKEEGIKWRTDSTNLESEFSRNRIRNEVFPQLEKINPSFLQSISESMNHLRQAQETLDNEFERKKNSLSRESGESFLIDISALVKETSRSYWLYRLLEPFGFNSSQLKEIEETLDCKTKTGRLFHSNDFTLVRDRDFLKVYKKDLTIRQPQVIICERSSDFDPKSLPAGHLCIDADSVTMPLSARLWTDGDKFRPFGMRGTRLVSDFLTDLKFDREQKRRQTVLVDGKERIVCVAGLRIDDRFKITEKTRNIAII